MPQQQDFSNQQAVQPPVPPTPNTAFTQSQPAFNGNQQFQSQQSIPQQPNPSMFSVQQSQTQNHYAPDPSVSAAALDKIVGPSNSSKINKESEEEQAALRERVFNSPATGFGDEELEVTVLSGVMKDQYVLEAHTDYLPLLI